MVGDTSDIDAAKAANIKSIAVAGGYTDRDVKTWSNSAVKNMKDIVNF